jgi:hypothetical protein
LTILIATPADRGGAGDAAGKNALIAAALDNGADRHAKEILPAAAAERRMDGRSGRKNILKSEVNR